MNCFSVPPAAKLLPAVAFLLTVPAAAATLPAAAAAPSPAATPVLTQEAMRQAAESFYSIGLDSTKAYAIAGARLQRDRLTIELESGSLMLAQSILGRITGACYSGRATIALTPPDPIERASLKARTGSEALRSQVDSLYLRFNDPTAADLTRASQPGSDAAALERCSKLFAARNEIVRRYEQATIGTPFNLELDLLESLLSPRMLRDFFLMEWEVVGQGWVTYFQRPGRGPQVVLARLKPVGSFFDPELWAGYDLQPDPAKALARLPAADIVHNQMEIVIPGFTAYTIDALISWKAPIEVGSARFSLINSFGGSTWDDPQAKPVTVQSVTAENGTPLPFVHRRHELLITLPSPLPPGETSRVRVKATEKTIQQITPESFMLLSTYPWFPQESEYLGGAYTFDWTVKVRRPYTAAGSGSVVRQWEEKDAKLNCEQWKSDTPLAFPSLIFGDFEETRGEYARKADGKVVPVRLKWMPKVTVTEERQVGGTERVSAERDAIEEPEDPEAVESAAPETQLLTVPLSKPPQIANDAATILDYFEQVLGPYPFEELDIAQMAVGFGFAQAPPGLVQITGEYFLSQGLLNTVVNDPRFVEFVRATLPHEIAHHYWGTQVRWKGDPHVWLSESLAEYCAGLYLQAAEGDKAFRGLRQMWRKMAERWEGPLPIAQATRSSGENAIPIRLALLYNKGPLVVHMLRTQAGNDNFLKILKSVLANNRGKWIDTADFEAASEAVLGYDMDWFFDQWVRGTGIPEVHISYTVTPQAGKFLLKARAVQTDRSRPKAFFLPVSFHFGAGRTGRKEWRIKTADETLQLMLPEKPERVVVDEFNDLLAKIVYE